MITINMYPRSDLPENGLPVQYMAVAPSGFSSPCYLGAPYVQKQLTEQLLWLPRE